GAPPSERVRAWDLMSLTESSLAEASRDCRAPLTLDRALRLALPVCFCACCCGAWPADCGAAVGASGVVCVEAGGGCPPVVTATGGWPVVAGGEGTSETPTIGVGMPGQW